MYRLKRGPVIAVALFVGVLLYLTSPWELASSIGFGAEPHVDELYGVLHLVTSADENDQHVLNDPKVDPTGVIDWDVYAANSAGINWAKELRRINKEHPIVVFSKTYCPYSRRAKQLLESYDIHPPPKVIEVDLREDGMVLKTLLTRLTGHSTFPNIIVQGKSIGGSDNLSALHAQKELRAVIESTGAKVKGKGPQVMRS